MMDRTFRLDTADIPQTVEFQDRAIEKMGLSQVIPPPGEYQVEIRTTAHTFPTTLTIDQECLRWNHTGGEEAICIEFTDT